MATRRRYRKKADQFVVAVKLGLDTEGFTYRQMGRRAEMQAATGCFDNNGDVYTVDAGVFSKTYRSVGPGIYVKTTPIWAEKATQPGSVATKEGRSHYNAGDYLVSNNEDGTDAYCISAANSSRCTSRTSEKRGQ